MAEIPVTSENPPTMEQRMERLEGSFSQILELLKTVIPEKEVINDNSNGDDNDGGGPSIKTNGENPHKVVIVTESSGPEVKVREEEAKMMDKMEMLEEKMRALQGIDVEDAIREGKLHGANNPHDKPKKPNFQKKEGEVHAVGTGNYPSKTISHHPVQQSSPYSLPPFYPYPYPSYPPNFHNPYQGGTSQVGNSAPPQVNNVSFPNQLPTFQNPPYQPRKERVKIDPVPIPYSDLYDTLLQQHLVAPEVPQPVSNPPPKWYNPAEACKYHMGAPGHSIEKCLTFKLRVQKLRDAGQLFFEEGEGKSTGTSIDKDPLLKH
ncbi:hypothetical protein SESBI_06151 [Sesbania bispinosa]|nr:hypothetical protein SESBI_06151 [Sesbania bispinosa]